MQVNYCPQEHSHIDSAEIDFNDSHAITYIGVSDITHMSPCNTHVCPYLGRFRLKGGVYSLF